MPCILTMFMFAKVNIACRGLTYIFFVISMIRLPGFSFSVKFLIFCGHCFEHMCKRDFRSVCVCVCVCLSVCLFACACVCFFYG